jgi:hypothetical protein
VQRFTAGVRAALADLPPAEADDILDDVRSHIAELTEELGPDAGEQAVVTRLGSPENYAAELRAAAGYPPVPAPSSPDPAVRRAALAARVAVLGLVASTVLVVGGVFAVEPAVALLGMLVALVGLPVLIRDGARLPSVAALPEVRRFVDAAPTGPVAGFLASLQPAWWLARAAIAVLLVVALYGQFEPAVVLVLALVALPVSIWLGHRSRRDRRWLWLVVPLNALAAALLLLFGVGQLAYAAPSADYGTSYSSSALPSGLYQDGEQILDIRPVDANGVPLSGVYLFNQDGAPIEVGIDWCGYGDLPTAAAAQPYPRGTPVYDDRTGACVLSTPGPLVVAVPTPAPTTFPGTARPVPPAPTLEQAPTVAPTAPLTPAPPTAQLTPTAPAPTPTG